MEPVQIGIIATALLLLLLVLGVHVAVSLGLVGFIGFWWVAGMKGALGLVRTTPFEIAATFDYTVLPLFILMGLFTFHSGLSGMIYRSAGLWLGRLPGGLAVATTAACGAFAAACGSSLATAAIFGRIGLPAMLEKGYDRRLAAGAIAASGTLASLIPPSAIMVLYGIFTEQSIGRMFVAGILPGVLSVALYMMMMIGWCRYNPRLAPRQLERVSWTERFASLRGIWALPVLVLLVLGGIYSGIFTATEAGAVGAFGAFIIAVASRRMTRDGLRDSLLETARTTAMIFAIIIGAVIFSRFLAVSRIPSELAEFLQGLPVPPMAILAGFLFMYLILGMFLDAIGIMAVTLPIVFPIIVGFGFDPIWFGILMVKMIEISFVTPPLGLNVYALKGVAGDMIALEEIFRGIVPFLMMDILTLAILVAFPQITLFLPTRMMG